jgi:hypothetical protein
MSFLIQLDISTDHELLLNWIIEFVCFRFLTISNEDIPFDFVFELGSLRVWDFSVCDAPEYLEMCNICLVSASEFLGVLLLRNACGHRFCMYTAHCTVSAQNSFGISLVLIIDLTHHVEDSPIFFSQRHHYAVMCKVLLKICGSRDSHSMN